MPLGESGGFAAGSLAGMWKLRIEDDQSNRTVVSLVRKRYTIGRAEPNSVRLTERNVSRYHAELERRGDVWVFRDLDSYTGSFVDDERVDGEVELGHASRIRVGDYMVVLYDDAIGEIASNQSAMTLPAVQPGDTSPAGPVDRFVVVEGPDVGAEFALDERRILIGRGEECDISLNDTSVSRVHADVEPDESGRYRIGDQASSNGVRVNGMEVESTTLYSGDIVELGDVRLQFVPKGQAYSPSDHPRATPRAAGFWGRLGPGQRLGLTAGSAALVGALVFWGGEEAPRPRAQSPGASAATMALAEAKEHFEAGRLEPAHMALRRISDQSNLRKSSTFRNIEREWARDKLRAAKRSDDSNIKRELLHAVAKTQSVPAEQRRAALDELERLEQEEAELVYVLDAGMDSMEDDMINEDPFDDDSAEVAGSEPVEIVRPEPATSPRKRPHTTPRATNPKPVVVRPPSTPARPAESTETPPSPRPSATQTPSSPPVPTSSVQRAEAPEARESGGARPSPEAPSTAKPRTSVPGQVVPSPGAPSGKTPQSPAPQSPQNAPPKLPAGSGSSPPPPTAPDGLGQ